MEGRRSGGRRGRIRDGRREGRWRGGRGADEVGGEVDEGRAGDAVKGGAVGIAQGLREGGKRGRAQSALDLRAEQRDGVELLEGAAAEERGLGGAGEEEEGGGVGGGVADLRLRSFISLLYRAFGF